jgi:predicted YcjX-like family ATPase
MSGIGEFLDDAWRAVADAGRSVGLATPTLRLGVTGLARAGKTVFTTALTQGLVGSTKLPAFSAKSEGRIRLARLAPQPNDAVARFAYEDHLAALTGRDRRWPESTRRISELRVLIDVTPRADGLFAGLFNGPRTVALDIVDYPGEWLLDLALLDKDYRTWADETLALARSSPRDALSGAYLALLDGVDPLAPLEEMQARLLADSFTQFLRACRDDAFSLSALPPGRFLLPGEMEGSPALTFAPLPPVEGAGRGTLHAAFERRYDAYKAHVVRPFFRDHFARLDRQIVLVDVLTAMNAGAEAMKDLELALAEVLQAFRAGRNSLLGGLFAPRIDRVLFAATKADQLHHTSHDRLEAVLSTLVARALARVEASGARTEVVALAAVRATREVEARQGGVVLPCIAGVPQAGESIDGQRFDGTIEAAVFPGDLPDRAADAFEPGLEGRFRAVRFRPPEPTRSADGRLQWLPHIRLDKTIEFLIGDRL